MASSNFRPFKVDGIDYIFNHEEFLRWYNLAARKFGKKETLKERLAAQAHRSIDAVAGWVTGYSGPSDPDTVKTVEAFFDAPAGSFLTPLKKPAEKTELEENVMREIKDYERDTARKVYAEMCDMIDGLEYMAFIDFRTEDEIPADTPDRFKGWKNANGTPVYLYRDKLLLNVRKAGFDLSKHVRDQLLDLIDLAFGDDISYDGKLYFASGEYMEFLEKNEFGDNDLTRNLYSNAYIKRLHEMLDDIFADYLRE